MKLSDFYGKYYNIYNEACKLKSFDILDNGVNLGFETKNGDSIKLELCPRYSTTVKRMGYSCEASIGHTYEQIKIVTTDIEVANLNKEIEGLQFYEFRNNTSLPSVIICKIETENSEIRINLIQQGDNE